MKQIVRPMLLLTVVVSLAYMTPAFADEQAEPDLAAAAQQSPGSPPAIPHAVKQNQDGEECNTCHRTGLKDAPPTSHPERLNCTSCHVQGEVKKEKKAAPKGKKKVTLSRKDFFKQGFFSLGETLLKATGTLQDAQDSSDSLPVADAPDTEPIPDENMVATADNRHCLAKNCGCFSCVDRCEPQAIMLIPGVGIRINPQLCTGCGICEYVCPVTPKAVTLHARTA